MSAQHTPGPWVVNPLRLNQVAAANGDLVIAEATVLHPAAVTVANARLIASAPDLPWMLKLLVSEHYGETGKSVLASQARATIAKATAPAVTYVDCGECPRISTGCQDRCAKATGSTP